MKLFCDGKPIRLRMSADEKNSMLVVGGSRMGKTFFVSGFASGLIRKGDIVHLIDLGQKWSAQDRKRLQSAGADVKEAKEEGVTLVFALPEELVGCAKHIANAVGFQSVNAITVLKGKFQKLISRKKSFAFQEIYDELKRKDENEGTDEKEWRGKVCERIETFGKLPDIRFCLQEEAFSQSSTIWDLAGIDETYVQIMACLILYCLLCQQKRFFGRSGAKRVFAIIDEFQNLDCDRRAIIGTCLTEGQKYRLNLILVTQFMDSNFSGAVIHQFKQGGFRFYFRLTEEEAKLVSKQIAYNASVRNQIYQKLIRLPRGQCLMIGQHSIEGSWKVLEQFRFLEVKMI